MLDRFSHVVLSSGFLLFVLFVASGCTRNLIEPLPSNNQGSRIKSVVIHYTALNHSDSIAALVDEGGLSAHYLIPDPTDLDYPDDTLRIYQLVEEQDRAWHAGESYWQGRSGLNDHSIGIELVNVPECPDTKHSDTNPESAARHNCIFPSFNQQQLDLLITLLKQVLERHPDLSPTAIIGHSDAAPNRKSDPGPQFPWYALYTQGLGAWYLPDTKTRYVKLFEDNLPTLDLVQTALRLYGYGIVETGIADAQTRDVVSAFKMHFTPGDISGAITVDMAATVFALLDRYFPDRLAQLMLRYRNDIQMAKRANVALPQGQVDVTFPQQNRSDRQYVNDRFGFYSYSGTGEISLTNESTVPLSTAIEINGQTLNLKSQYAPGETVRYSIGRRTQDGTNTFKLAALSPGDSTLRIQIPFPILQKSPKGQYDFSAIDALINQDIENGFPGAVVLVAHRGNIVKHQAYGFAQRYDENGRELDSPIPMHKDTLFDLASNTKIYATTFAIMKLVESGQLDLDRALVNYLPEFSGEGRDAITTRDLLTHSAGFAPEVRFFDSNRYDNQSLFSQRAPRTKQLLLKEVPIESSRRTSMRYSDTSFMILGILVERLSGLSLDSYVESNLYIPLGLQRTRFNPLDKLPAPTRYAATELQGNTRGGKLSFDNIRTHTLVGEVHDEKAFYSMQGVSGHAGLFSTAQELAVLAQLMLNGGGYGDTRLFSESTLNHFILPSAIDANTGLGFRRAGLGQRKWQFGPYASENAFGHSGWTGTLTIVDPEHDLVIVLLTNMRHTPTRTFVNQSGYETYYFEGQSYETGRYGSIVSLIYESILHRSEAK